MSLLTTAASGMQSQTARLDAISNNIANLDTAGYQTTDVSFADMLTEVNGQSPLVQGLPDRLTPTGVILGTGSYALPSERNFAPGAYQHTGMPLDMAIQGDGFFLIGMPNGQTGYTRAGNFKVSTDAQGQMYLSTPSGQPVLGANGKLIDMTGVNQQSVTVSATGLLQGRTVTGAPVQIGQLGLAYINVPQNALHSMGQDVYELNTGFRAATNAAGTLGSGLVGSVSNGTLEMGNVNLTTQMSDMVETQQNFQMTSQAFNIADQMMGIANQIK